MPDDAQLLRQYADTKAEDAFKELVRRHLDGVYSAALRRVGGDTYLAEDVVQQVFAALARKAAVVAQHPFIGAWLYTTTRNEAANVVRQERRRKAREQQAFTMNELNEDRESRAADWSRIAPVLDEMIDQLGDLDRAAIVLRFVERKGFAAVGEALEISEDAARKRVDRALDKLEELLTRRGVTSTAAALGVILSGEAVMAAPAGLAMSVTGTAMAGATGAGGAGTSLWALVAGAKTILVGAVALAVGGVGVAWYEAREVRTITEMLGGVVSERDGSQAELAAMKKRAGAAEQSANEAKMQVVALRTELLAAKAKALPGVKSAASALAAASASTEAVAVTPAPAMDEAATQRLRTQLHRRYDAFLMQQRGLTQEQTEKFVDLQIEQGRIREDLQASVRAAGATGGTRELEALRSKLYAPVTQGLRDLLGAEGYKAYTEFSSSSFYQVGYIDPMLPMFANAPLSAEQQEDLIRVVRANERQVRLKPTDLGTESQVNWDGVATQVGGVLTPEQARIFDAYVKQQKQRR